MKVGIKVIAEGSLYVTYREPVNDGETPIYDPTDMNMSQLPTKLQEIVRDFFADINEYNVSVYNKLTA